MAISQNTEVVPQHEEEIVVQGGLGASVSGEVQNPPNKCLIRKNASLVK